MLFSPRPHTAKSLYHEYLYLNLFSPKKHSFDIINLDFTVLVLPHVDVDMAVRFLRRVDSSDYIEIPWGNPGKGARHPEAV